MLRFLAQTNGWMQLPFEMGKTVETSGDIKSSVLRYLLVMQKRLKKQVSIEMKS